MVDIPQIPAMNLSNRALVEMGRSSAAMENFTKAIASKAGKELMKAIDQYNEVLKIAGTIEAADTYAANTRKRAVADTAKDMVAVDKATDILNKSTAGQNKLLDERSANLTAAIAANDGRKGALDGREGLVEDREKAVHAREELQDVNISRIAKADIVLNERGAALAEAEASLKARVDRINAATA